MNKVFTWLLHVILAALSLLVLYWFIQLLLGGSPGLNEFNFGLIVLILGFMVKMYRELGEMKIGMQHSFIKIKEEMTQIKEPVALIQKKLKVP